MLSSRRRVLSATTAAAIVLFAVLAVPAADDPKLFKYRATPSKVILCTADFATHAAALSYLNEGAAEGKLQILDGSTIGLDVSGATLVYIGPRDISSSEECLSRHPGLQAFVAQQLHEAPDVSPYAKFGEDRAEASDLDARHMLVMCSPGTSRCFSFGHAYILGYDTFVCEETDFCQRSETRLTH